MEIRRIGENQIRCALTEEEIHSLGFDIDEIIANSETTQQFMRVVLGLVEEHEDISMENISPMMKAELLQNHSMAITFGGDSELSFKNLMNTVSHIMSQMESGKLEEKKRKEQVDDLTQESGKADAMVCALCFNSLLSMSRMCRVCFPGRAPMSSIYKLETRYYLVLDFAGFTKEEMRPFAFGTVEYDDGHCSDPAQIAHIREHGSCIMESGAIDMLQQL